jgi:hypothetical protein
MRAGTRLLAWLALPNWPVFPGPQAQTVVPSPRSAYPGAANAGASCRDLLPPRARNGKSAGIQARRGEGAGACSFDRFLPQGVDDPTIE